MGLLYRSARCVSGYAVMCVRRGGRSCAAAFSIHREGWAPTTYMSVDEIRVRLAENQPQKQVQKDSESTLDREGVTYGAERG